MDKRPALGVVTFAAIFGLVAGYYVTPSTTPSETSTKTTAEVGNVATSDPVLSVDNNVSEVPTGVTYRSLPSPSQVQIVPAIEVAVPPPAFDMTHPRYGALKERFASEPVSVEWALRVEKQVYDRLASTGYGFADARILCKTTICRLDLVADVAGRSEEDARSFATSLFRDVGQPVFSGNGLNRMQGAASTGGTATFYIFESDLFAARPSPIVELQNSRGLQIPFDELQQLTQEGLRERARIASDSALD